MKQIAYIIPSLLQGGLENHASVLINEIAKDKNLKVTVLCCYNNPIFYQLHPSVTLIVPPFERKERSALVYYLKVFIFLRKNLLSIKPDTVISFGDYINFIRIMVAKSLSLPIFVQDGASPATKFSRIVKFFRRITYPRAKGIIVQTQRAQKITENLVKNGVPVKINVNPLRELKINSVAKEKVILCVARHYHVKGIDRMLEAFVGIENRDWRLEIAGSEGPETSKLNSLAERLGISDRVIFLGAIKEIDRVYSRASIFVLPSRSEGLPNALIEAMAHGLPCISFDINAGPSDLIQNGVNGILVEDGNIKELTEQINRLIVHENLRNTLGSNAVSIRKKHEVSNVCNDLLDFVFRY